MSDSDKPSGPWERRATTGATKIPENWWQRLERFLRARRSPGPGADARGGGPPRLFRTGAWMLAIWVVLICLPIGSIILGYIRRPAAGTTGITSGTTTPGGAADSGDKIPKPSPSRPMLPVSQAPPPTITSPAPAPTPIAPVPPPQIATPQRPLPPMATPAPPPAIPAPPSSATPKLPFNAVTYPARHDKRFGDECAGQLTLNASGLYFSCPGNGGEGVQAPVNQIDAVDENGIRLYSGKKYHFTIPGMSKSGEKALFADWLNHVR